MFAATEVVCVLCVCVGKNWPQHLEAVENGDWGTVMACLDSNCASHTILFSDKTTALESPLKSP